jgi:hypothetical protein
MTDVVTGASYVFGVVPAGVPPPASADTAITEVRLVTRGALAAVVGSVPSDRPLGRAADLRAHDRVIADLVAAGTPVLPFRFGAVVADDRAVEDELLDAHHDEFVAALATVTGRVQYTVKARYEQDAVLRELLEQRPDIASLRSATRQSMSDQLRLGEVIVAALADLRVDDAATVQDTLAPQAVDVRLHETTAPDDVLHAAFLVERATEARFEQAVEDLGRRLAGRIRLRLVGPLAAYDFVREP